MSGKGETEGRVRGRDMPQSETENQLANKIANELNELQRAGAEQRWQRRQRQGPNAALECSPLALAGAALETGELIDARNLVSKMTGPEAATGAESDRIRNAAELCDKVRTAYGRLEVEFRNRGLHGKIATDCGCDERTVRRILKELKLAN